jgi:serine/threonine protein phosphatase PrpC
MFGGIASLALIGLVGFVIVAFFRGRHTLPPMEEADRMPGPIRLVSAVTIRREGMADTVGCVARDERQAWALIDGLEGHADPEGAVRVIASSIESGLEAGDPRRSLLDSVARANLALLEGPRPADPSLARAACVAVVAREGRKLHIGHAGLVRVYRVRGGLVDLLTVDHSPLGDLIRIRSIPYREAATLLEDPTAPHRTVTSRAVGVSRDMGLATQEIDIAPGDAFVVTCATVSRQVTRRQVAESRAASGGDVQAWMDGILDAPTAMPSLWGSRAVLVLRSA